jgi:hypothetical protein
MPRDMAQPPKRPQVNDAFDSVADAKNTIKFYYSVAYPNQKIKVFKSNAAKFIRCPVLTFPLFVNPAPHPTECAVVLAESNATCFSLLT